MLQDRRSGQPNHGPLSQKKKKIHGPRKIIRAYCARCQSVLYPFLLASMIDNAKEQKYNFIFTLRACIRVYSVEKGREVNGLDLAMEIDR